MYFIFFLVSFLASVVGAICGIGGGVIIKPLLDAAGIMSVSAISFLSGCTVFAMSAVSVGSSMRNRTVHVKFVVTLPLAIGAAVGGLAGKTLFQAIKNMVASENTVGSGGNAFGDHLHHFSIYVKKKQNTYFKT